MKTIAEIHVENLDELAKPFGSQRQFAIHLNKDPKQVNQWWGKGSARGIGPQLARELEAHFEKPRGWLDNDHSQLQRLDAAIILAAVRLASGAVTGVGLSHFDIETEDDAELFALAIEEVMDDGITLASDSDVQRFARKLQSRKEEQDGEVGTAGSDGGVGRSTGKAQARDAQGPAGGRKRKSA